MIKVGILTFHGSHNYGAMLQAYALQQKCIELGTECSIIDYRSPEMINDYAVFKKGKTLKIVIKNLLQVFRYSSNKARYNKFEEFIKKNLITTKRYSSLEELKAAPPEMDVYIVGSDQVWNGTNKLKDVYFLPFGRDGVKKISYAASFGDKVPRQEFTDVIKNLLDEFAAISVREKSGVDYIYNIMEKQAEIMCDPVMLLSREKWETLGDSDIELPKTYIFCYALGELGNMQEIIDCIKEMTGFQVVTVCDSIKSQISCDKVYYDVGPVDFLTLVKHSKCIITNSFHGTVFSLLFQKPFYAVKRREYSERINTVLQLFGMEDRYIETSAEVRNIEVGFDNARDIREDLEQKAVQYLVDYLR